MIVFRKGIGVKAGATYIMWRDISQKDLPPCLIVEYGAKRIFSVFFSKHRTFLGYERPIDDAEWRQRWGVTSKSLLKRMFNR